MDRSAAVTPTPVSITFRDGLGERRLTAAPDGRAREVLRIRSELAEVGAFEFALRERVARLSQFEHEQFAQVRSVERLSEDASTLAVVTDYVDGVRLSDLLVWSIQRGLHFDLNAALAVLRPLVAAVAALHETTADVAHGTLGPERVIVTSDGRVVITDYVLGAAVEQLRFSQQRYWHQLHVALPRSAGHPRVDQRADATQIGVVALSLILGRPLRDDEYPARVGEVVGAAWAVSSGGGFEPLPPGLRGWLGRALQLDQRNSFENAVDARAELGRVLADCDPASCAASFETFLTSYRATAGDYVFGPAMALLKASSRPRSLEETSSAAHPPGSPHVSGEVEAETGESPTARNGASVPAPTSPAEAIPVLLSPESSLDLFDPEPAAATAPTAEVAGSAAGPVSSSAGAIGTRDTSSPLVSASGRRSVPHAATKLRFPVTRLRPASRSEQLEHPDQVLVAVPPTRQPPSSRDRRHHLDRRDGGRPGEMFGQTFGPPPRGGLRVIGVAIGLAVVVGGSMLAGRRLGATPALPPATTGTVEIRTNPSGARVVIDGRQASGMTPVTLTVGAGTHALELSSEGRSRSVPLSVIAGGHTSQFVELPAPRPAITRGRLDVRTEPAGVVVTIDDTPRGTTPTTIPDLPPGDHVVVLHGPRGQLRRVVSIEADVTTTLDVRLGAGGSSPDRGWLALSAPIDLAVSENGRDLGHTSNGRIALTPGRHTLELVNDAIGYRSRKTLQIVAGQVQTLRLDVPTGSLAVDASPWAEVWVDGRPIGHTPLSNVGVAIGRHEVTLRHPDLGERRRQIVVGSDAPTRLMVDLVQP